MTIALNVPDFVGFLLALVRAGVWVTITPPLNNRSINRSVRAGLAAALALAASHRLGAQLGPGPYDTLTLLNDAVVQAFVGATLGVVAIIVFSAVASAGSYIDLFGGFTISSAFDPFLNAQNSVFGRLYELVAIMLLFAINGHLVLVEGFLHSFDAISLHAPKLNTIGQVLIRDLKIYLTAAVEIAAPLIAALFLAQVTLGLLARAAPAMQVFALSFPFTILLTLLLAGMVARMLPGEVRSVLDQVQQSFIALTR